MRGHLSVISSTTHMHANGGKMPQVFVASGKQKHDQFTLLLLTYKRKYWCTQDVLWQEHAHAAAMCSEVSKWF